MFLPCMVPSGMGTSGGTPSASWVASPGILNTTQCGMSSKAFAMWASASCRINTKLAVPLGTLDHFNSGETPVDICMGPLGGGVVAEHVYLIGIVPPSVNAAIVSVSGAITFGRTGGRAVACCAATGRMLEASRSARSEEHTSELQSLR